MFKDICKKYYFDGNYNCAETILRAGNEYYDLGLHDRDMILVGAFGGGIQGGHTCGAILSGAAILSMKYVEAKAHESDNIKPVVNLLTRKFADKFDSLLCEKIKEQNFVEEMRCYKTIEAACEIIEETIAEFEASKA